MNNEHQGECRSVLPLIQVSQSIKKGGRSVGRAVALPSSCAPSVRLSVRLYLFLCITKKGEILLQYVSTADPPPHGFPSLGRFLDPRGLAATSNPKTTRKEILLVKERGIKPIRKMSILLTRIVSPRTTLQIFFHNYCAIITQYSEPIESFHSAIL